MKGAQGYNILWGIAPDKLYSSWMVYDKTDLLMKTLTADKDYYFCVEAFNENGVDVYKRQEYGFKDAFNLTEDWFAPSYLAIDQ